MLIFTGVTDFTSSHQFKKSLGNLRPLRQKQFVHHVCRIKQHWFPLWDDSNDKLMLFLKDEDCLEGFQFVHLTISSLFQWSTSGDTRKPPTHPYIKHQHNCLTWHSKTLKTHFTTKGCKSSTCLVNKLL